MLGKLNFLTVDWPLRQDRLFAQARPLIVEIGFGNGDFLVHLAHTNPECNIVGLEISSQSMERAEAKIERYRLENARTIHARAETALAHMLEPESVHAFHINNPDPWFKKKHRRRRLITRETVDLLTSRLVPGGELHLATDVREYADMAQGLLSHTPGLSNLFDAPWVNEVVGRFRTKYELKGYQEGREGHFFSYERNHMPSIHPSVVKELDMPHLFLKSALDATEIVEGFTPTRTSTDGRNIAILGAYANPANNSAVFEVVVKEPTIEQHAMLALTPREEAGQYIVKLTEVGHARPTYGMHRAVEALGEWVASLDARSRILERKLRS